MPATGVVTLDGQPVAEATVQFHPTDAAGALQACIGVTDSQGVFEARTHVGLGKYKPGAMPGEYRVSVTKMGYEVKPTTMRPPDHLIPKTYSDPRASGFKASVDPSAENNFSFELKSK
ncbi:MAG: hypothetical protein ACRCT8_04805 [Lacipirellulaceae bacterium]